MDWALIRTLVVKDVTLFFRNRFFALITVLALAGYVALYFALPSNVDETFTVGLYAPDASPALLDRFQSEGLETRLAASDAELRQLVLNKKVEIGVVLDSGLLQALSSGTTTNIPIYIAADMPPEFKEALVANFRLLFNDLSYRLSGQPLNVDVTEEIIGPDTSGAPIPLRQRMVPLLAIVVLMMETMGLATLLAEEIQARTLPALLATRLDVTGLFLSKTITGVGMTFVQALLLLAIIGGLRRQPLLMATALLLGSLLVTGIGFLIASVGKDFMSVLGWGMLALIVLILPSIGVLLPGAMTGWVRYVPSYYLVDTVNRVANFGAGWGDVWGSLLILYAASLAFLGLGIVTLTRRFA